MICSLLFAVSLMTATARASVLDVVLGFRENPSLLNASCQGLLGYAGGIDGAQAIAILRGHRVRALNRANAEAKLAGTFTANENSKARVLDQTAAHIRGIERWTATGHGEVRGFVLRGGDAMTLHYEKLGQIREMIAAGRREDESVDQGLSLARLIMNVSSVALINAAILSPPWGPVALLPALAVIDPISANRAWLSPDRAAAGFMRDLNAAVARPDHGRWLFASRTYAVRDVVLDAIHSRDPRRVVDAMREQNWAEINMLLGATHARRRRAYLVIDQLLRFTPEPELVITVRMTRATPKSVFAGTAVPAASHPGGTATQR